MSDSKINDLVYYYSRSYERNSHERESNFKIVQHANKHNSIPLYIKFERFWFNNNKCEGNNTNCNVMYHELHQHHDHN